MALDAVFERFIAQSPVSVMFRGALENVLAADRLDVLFERTAQRQYVRDLLFSNCVDIMSLVVCQIQPSVNAAYQARKQAVAVSVKALYDKLSGVEPAVSEALVRSTAADLACVADAIEPAAPWLSSAELRIVDGNYLAGTEHRVQELRSTGAAALPGMSLPIFDPQRGLVEDVIVCEDGHANERSLVGRLLEKVQAGQCWMADCNFSTLKMFFGIAARKATFIIRQHGALHGVLVGKRKKLGRISTGMVYEQVLQVTDAEGETLHVRRITLQLDEPTRDGATEIHLLSNLPAGRNGKKIAQLYAQRWTVETAFQELTTALRSEINTLGYPAAALFGFCVALVMYNVLQTVKTALRAAHRPKPASSSKLAGSRFSMYYLAHEISGVYQGMMIAIPSEHWTAAFAQQSPQALAKQLLWLAKRVEPRRFYTNPWTPKRPQPKRASGKRGNHLSTHRLLKERVREP
jgi:IS4 transposase